MKHVFEFRYQSWLEDKVFHVLHKHNAGLFIFDIPSISCPVVATTDFACVRFHDSTGLYYRCYSDKELAAWAERLTSQAPTPNLKAVHMLLQ